MSLKGDAVTLEIPSAAPAPETAPLPAAAGYAFFLACFRIEAMRGTVSGESGAGSARINVRLPRTADGQALNPDRWMAPALYLASLCFVCEG